MVAYFPLGVICKVAAFIIMFQCNLFNLLTDLMPTPQPKTRPTVVTQPTPTTPPALTHPIPTKSPPTTGTNEYFFARGPLSLFHRSLLMCHLQN